MAALEVLVVYASWLKRAPAAHGDSIDAPPPTAPEAVDPAGAGADEDMGPTVFKYVRPDGERSLNDEEDDDDEDGVESPMEGDVSADEAEVDRNVPRLPPRPAALGGRPYDLLSSRHPVSGNSGPGTRSYTRDTAFLV